MNFKFWRKPKSIELTEEEKWDIWCPGSGNPAHILEPVQYGGVVVSTFDPSSFKSTAASQWSTAGGHYKRRPELGVVKLSKSRDGKLNGVEIRTDALRQQVAHWKWLAKNPRLARIQVVNVMRHRQTLRDSALFL
jgi:hypothetical protein